MYLEKYIENYFSRSNLVENTHFSSVMKEELCNFRHREKKFSTITRRELQFSVLRIRNLCVNNYAFLPSPQSRITQFLARNAQIPTKYEENYGFLPTLMSILVCQYVQFWGEGGEVIRAMSKRKHFFLPEVFLQQLISLFRNIKFCQRMSQQKWRDDKDSTGRCHEGPRADYWELGEAEREEEQRDSFLSVRWHLPLALLVCNLRRTDNLFCMTNSEQIHPYLLMGSSPPT